MSAALLRAAILTPFCLHHRTLPRGPRVRNRSACWPPTTDLVQPWVPGFHVQALLPLVLSVFHPAPAVFLQTDRKFLRCCALIGERATNGIEERVRLTSLVRIRPDGGLARSSRLHVFTRVNDPVNSFDFEGFRRSLRRGGHCR